MAQVRASHRHTSSSEHPQHAATGKADWARLAIDAAKGGDYENAVDLFVTAISHDRRNAGLRHNLAIALERNGEIDDAAVSLTDALRLKPGMPEAAQRLAHVLGKYEIEEPARLDTAGLYNAMSVPGIAVESIAQTAIAILKIGGPLREAIENGQWNGWDSTADALIRTRTAPLLRDPLFLRALSNHINQDSEVELLLAALRRAILRLTPDRFGDKTVVAFAIALATQCLSNEHVFDVEADEQQEAIVVGAQAKLGAKLLPEDMKAVLVSLMYSPPNALVEQIDDFEKLKSMKPKALREFVLPIVARYRQEAALCAAVPATGLIADTTSQAVAAQYEERPYPRWHSLRVAGEGTMRSVLERFFTSTRLAFMAQPFSVLVAGCGTGRHALEVAVAYGPNARVTAIDLSRRSLAYGMREAQDRKIHNVTFLQADLLDPSAVAQQFDFIDCSGVLHHLEKPLDGLKALVDRLKPGGMMQVALYSAVSREELSELRFEENYPGLGCSEEAARRYRAILRDRTPDMTGGELTNSEDFWSLSGFRDLVLHVSEQQFTLPEIRDALDSHGLIFRGFTLHPQVVAEFMAAHSGEHGPGQLETWWAWEQENPRLFDGMYSFWAESPLPKEADTHA